MRYLEDAEAAEPEFEDALASLRKPENKGSAVTVRMMSARPEPSTSGWRAGCRASAAPGPL